MSQVALQTPQASRVSVEADILGFMKDDTADYEALRHRVLAFLRLQYANTPHYIPDDYLKITEEVQMGVPFYVLHKMDDPARFDYYPMAGVYDYDRERGYTGANYTGIYADWGRDVQSGRFHLYRTYYPKKENGWGYTLRQVQNFALRTYDCPKCMKGVQILQAGSERVKKLRSITEYKSNPSINGEENDMALKDKLMGKSINLYEDAIFELLTVGVNIPINLMGTRGTQFNWKFWGGIASMAAAKFMGKKKALVDPKMIFLKKWLEIGGWKNMFNGLDTLSQGQIAWGSYVQSEIINDIMRVTRAFSYQDDIATKLKRAGEAALSEQGKQIMSKVMKQPMSYITNVKNQSGNAMKWLGVGNYASALDKVREPPMTKFANPQAETRVPAMDRFSDIMIRIPKN